MSSKGWFLHTHHTPVCASFTPTTHQSVLPSHPPHTSLCFLHTHQTPACASFTPTTHKSVLPSHPPHTCLWLLHTQVCGSFTPTTHKSVVPSHPPHTSPKFSTLPSSVTPHFVPQKSLQFNKSSALHLQICLFTLTVPVTCLYHDILCPPPPRIPSQPSMTLPFWHHCEYPEILCHLHTSGGTPPFSATKGTCLAEMKMVWLVLLSMTHLIASSIVASKYAPTRHVQRLTMSHPEKIWKSELNIYWQDYSMHTQIHTHIHACVCTYLHENTYTWTHTHTHTHNHHLNTLILSLSLPPPFSLSNTHLHTEVDQTNNRKMKRLTLRGTALEAVINDVMLVTRFFSCCSTEIRGAMASMNFWTHTNQYHFGNSFWDNTIVTTANGYACTHSQTYSRMYQKREKVTFGYRIITNLISVCVCVCVCVWVCLFVCFTYQLNRDKHSDI